MESVDRASELMCCVLMSVIAGVGFARARFVARESRAPRRGEREVNGEDYLPESINGWMAGRETVDPRARKFAVVIVYSYF